MGKANRDRILEQFGPNETNLNPNDDAYRLACKAERYAARSRSQQMAVYKRIRKMTKKISRVRRRDYAKAKAQLFGYWFYWFKEGKIGPDSENNEPQLLASRYMQNQKKMEHLLDHV